MEHPYEERLRRMTLNEVLEEMDEYGKGHFIIHEAAKRIRRLEMKNRSVKRGMRRYFETLEQSRLYL